MNDVIGQLLPLAVGVAISPILIIAAILMLLAAKGGGTSVGFLLAGSTPGPDRRQVHPAPARGRGTQLHGQVEDHVQDGGRARVRPTTGRLWR